MQPNPAFWRDKRVCVTGGTGFLGWHVARLLLPLARQVRVLGLEPGSEALAAALREIDCVYADVRDAAAVRNAVSDRDIVFHAAGAVGVWGAALARMREVHELGTRNVLEALSSGARLVHTSSVVAVGASRAPSLLDESAAFGLEQLRVDYVHAKRVAEALVLAAADRGADAVVVNPGYLVGPEDHEASVMGRFCLRCWQGKVPLVPPGGMNFVDVRDAALGHLLAAERGARGRRYILGGENLAMTEFVHELARVRGMRARAPRMPGWLNTAAACVAEMHARYTGREPYPSFQHARLTRYYWHYSSARARAELGYEPRPLAVTLADTHEWYCRAEKLAEIVIRES
jgi:dihydroflavonol-4-reductase